MTSTALMAASLDGRAQRGLVGGRVMMDACRDVALSSVVAAWTQVWQGQCFDPYPENGLAEDGVATCMRVVLRVC